MAVTFKKSGQFEVAMVSQSGKTTLGFTDTPFGELVAYLKYLEAQRTDLDFWVYKIFENGEDMYIPA